MKIMYDLIKWEYSAFIDGRLYAWPVNGPALNTEAEVRAHGREVPSFARGHFDPKEPRKEPSG